VEAYSTDGEWEVGDVNANLHPLKHNTKTIRLQCVLLYRNIDQTHVNSLHGLLICEIG